MAIEIAHINESDYNEILLQAVAVIDGARTVVARSVSTAANMAYWNIGKLLNEKQLEGKYGDGVVRRLSVDLKQRFPDMGVAPRNLWNMRRFYTRFSGSDAKVQRSVALLPWSHILMLMSKELDDAAVLYYANETVRKGWNRDLLLNAIKMEMHLTHQTTLVDNNFSQVLPATQAIYANEVFSSGYNLGFLSVTEPIAELELERRLVDYLSILDRTERHEDENHSIGIILCAEKDHVDVELALEGVNKPIGVADYQLILPRKELAKIVQDEIDIYLKDNQSEKE